MTQENFLSALRAVLILVGSYLVGHSLFGHTLTSDAWQVWVGAIVSLVSTVWGIVTKSTTIEAVESAVRSIVTGVGGLLVSAGILSSDNLNAILGLVVAIAPLFQSFLSKAKTQAVANGTITPNGKGLMVKKAA